MNGVCAPAYGFDRHRNIAYRPERTGLHVLQPSAVVALEQKPSVLANMATCAVDERAAHVACWVVDQVAREKRDIKAVVEIQGLDIGKNTRGAVRHSGKHFPAVVHRRDARTPFEQPPREPAGAAAKLEHVRTGMK